MHCVPLVSSAPVFGPKNRGVTEVSNKKVVRALPDEGLLNGVKAHHGDDDALDRPAVFLPEYLEGGVFGQKESRLFRGSTYITEIIELDDRCAIQPESRRQRTYLIRAQSSLHRGEPKPGEEFINKRKGNSEICNAHATYE